MGNPNHDAKQRPSKKNRVTSNIRKARIDYFKRELDESSKDPRAFWKLMKKVLPCKRKHTVINKITVDGTDIIDSKDIANTLNSYFSNIPKQLLAMQNTCQYTDSFFWSTTQDNESRFNFKPISEAEIRKQLTFMKPNKATGYDKLPVNILKLSASSISKCLATIVNSSFEQGIFPKLWKIGRSSCQ